MCATRNGAPTDDALFLCCSDNDVSYHKVGGECKCEKITKEQNKNAPQSLSGGKKTSRRFLFVFPRIYPKILHLRAYFTYTVYKINIISLSTLRQCSMRIPTNNADIHMPWIFIVATFRTLFLLLIFVFFICSVPCVCV